MLDTEDHRVTRAAIDEQVELWLEQHADEQATEVPDRP